MAGFKRAELEAMHQRRTEAAGRAADDFNRQQDEAADRGGKFYKRLSLLSGGTIVLSVTFVGQLREANAAHSAFPPSDPLGLFSSTPAISPAILGMPLLFVSWFALFLAVVAGIYFSYFNNRHRYFVAGATFMEKRRDLEESYAALFADGARLVDADGGQIETAIAVAERTRKSQQWADMAADNLGQSKLAFRLFRWCEHLAQAGFIIGSLCLLTFAAMNLGAKPYISAPAQAPSAVRQPAAPPVAKH